MNIVEAHKQLLERMDEHGLIKAGWRAGWNNRNKHHGVCSHYRKTIFLSQPLTLINDDKIVQDTILHEIAHALIAPGHKHNVIWQLKAISIGALPHRTCINGKLPPPKHIYYCSCSEHKTYRRIDINNRICSRCKGNLSKVSPAQAELLNSIDRELAFV